MKSEIHFPAKSRRFYADTIEEALSLAHQQGYIAPLISVEPNVWLGFAGKSEFLTVIIDQDPGDENP